MLFRSGNLLSTSLTWPAPDINVAAISNFRDMLDPNSPDVMTTESREGRMSGRWTFYIARKVRAANGALLGVAVVGLDPAYFAKLFSSLALGDSSWVTLFRDDGALLAISLDHPGLMGRFYPNAIPVRLEAMDSVFILGGE